MSGNWTIRIVGSGSPWYTQGTSSAFPSSSSINEECELSPGVVQGYPVPEQESPQERSPIAPQLPPHPQAAQPSSSSLNASANPVSANNCLPNFTNHMLIDPFNEAVPLPILRDSLASCTSSSSISSQSSPSTNSPLNPTSHSSVIASALNASAQLSQIFEPRGMNAVREAWSFVQQPPQLNPTTGNAEQETTEDRAILGQSYSSAAPGQNSFQSQAPLLLSAERVVRAISLLNNPARAASSTPNSMPPSSSASSSHSSNHSSSSVSVNPALQSDGSTRAARLATLQVELKRAKQEYEGYETEGRLFLENPNFVVIQGSNEIVEGRLVETPGRAALDDRGEPIPNRVMTHENDDVHEGEVIVHPQGHWQAGQPRLDSQWCVCVRLFDRVFVLGTRQKFENAAKNIASARTNPTSEVQQRVLANVYQAAYRRNTIARARIANLTSEIVRLQIDRN